MTLDTGCNPSVTLPLHCGVWTPASAYEGAPDEL
jgi:hypothetical protein